MLEKLSWLNGRTIEFILKEFNFWDIVRASAHVNKTFADSIANKSILEIFSRDTMRSLDTNESSKIWINSVVWLIVIWLISRLGLIRWLLLFYLFRSLLFGCRWSRVSCLLNWVSRKRLSCLLWFHRFRAIFIIISRNTKCRHFIHDILLTRYQCLHHISKR